MNITKFDTVEAVNGVIPPVYLQSGDVEYKRRFTQAVESIGWETRPTTYYVLPLHIMGERIYIEICGNDQLRRLITGLESHGVNMKEQIGNYDEYMRDSPNEGGLNV